MNDFQFLKVRGRIEHFRKFREKLQKSKLDDHICDSPFSLALMCVYCSMARKRLNRIKIVLAEQDRSSTWLAEQLGKNKSTISRWCSNSIQPTVEGLFEIARVLEVDVRELLVGTGE